jgi:hypothetical protein
VQGRGDPAFVYDEEHDLFRFRKASSPSLASKQTGRFLREGGAFRERAAGRFPHYGRRGGYRYYVYDLLDWLMDQRQEA